MMLSHGVEPRLDAAAGTMDGTGGTIHRRRDGARPSMDGIGTGRDAGGHLPRTMRLFSL